MERILISEFKAKCIAILHRVSTTKEPIIVTRRGKPLVRIEPVLKESPRRLGELHGALQILDDIVYTDTSNDWEMLDESSS